MYVYFLSLILARACTPPIVASVSVQEGMCTPLLNSQGRRDELHISTEYQNMCRVGCKAISRDLTHDENDTTQRGRDCE